MRAAAIYLYHLLPSGAQGTGAHRLQGLIWGREGVRYLGGWAHGADLGQDTRVNGPEYSYWEVAPVPCTAGGRFELNPNLPLPHPKAEISATVHGKSEMSFTRRHKPRCFLKTEGTGLRPVQPEAASPGPHREEISCVSPGPCKALLPCHQTYPQKCPGNTQHSQGSTAEKGTQEPCSLHLSPGHRSSPAPEL